MEKIFNEFVMASPHEFEFKFGFKLESKFDFKSKPKSKYDEEVLRTETSPILDKNIFNGFPVAHCIKLQPALV